MFKLNSLLLRLSVGARKFHTTRPALIDVRNVEEVRIPVPWGHIAGKWWGNQNKQPLLLAHGMLDNCGSFDNLVPLLEVESALCIDLPGHGLSSHRPPSLGAYYFDNIFLLRYLIDNYFKWDKVSFIGHSYGSSLFFVYSGIYPDRVDKMVNIDCARVHNREQPVKTVASSRKTMDQLETLRSSQKTNKGFSLEECLKHTLTMRKNIKLPISEQSCQILIKRGVVNVGSGKFRFSHDPALKVTTLGRPTDSFIRALCSQITCKVLNISVPGEGGLHFGKYLAEIEQQIEIMKKACDVKHEKVDGGHHVHLEHPNNVAPLINNFLSN